YNMFLIIKFINFLLALLLLISCGPTEQTTEDFTTQKTYKINTVAFYNLENLFDTIDDPNRLDERSPIMEIPKGKRGKIYWQKINNMAKVISEIGRATTQTAPAIV